ncbi:MAG: NAD-dependent epimerase/dehydratase family protein [Polyangiaceae bacterium]|nr:NAD-dependent epimerase/dehydratase family protein [Polyangiaceae bacterium]
MSLSVYSGSRVLVVGGAGFVGSNLVRKVLGLGAKEVVVVDNFLSSERSNLPEATALRVVEGSIADSSLLESIGSIWDYVFHLATYHGNQSSIADPIADHDNNTLTTLKLFDFLKHSRGIRKIVYASAGCTVAEKTYEHATATTEDAPISLYYDSPYQISKVVGEMYANYYHARHGLPVVKARFQNVYGPGEVLGAGKWRGTPATVWRNVTPSFVYRALKGMPITVDNGGQTSRDFIFVDDIVRGLLLGGSTSEPGAVFNLASGVETTILTLAETIQRLAGSHCEIIGAPKRDWDRSGKRFGSTEQAQKTLGFSAEVGLEAGLKATIEWTQSNLERIEACIQRHSAHMATSG